MLLFLEFSGIGSGSEVCFIVEVFDVFGFFIIGFIDRKCVYYYKVYFGFECCLC